MALNDRQDKWLRRVQSISDQMVELQGKIFREKESWDEEFSAAQENAMNTTEAVAALATKGLTYDSLTQSLNQGFGNFTNFMTGAAVTTREYGLEFRRIASKTGL